MSRPTIVVLRLRPRPWWDESYSTLTAKLQAKSNVQVVTTADEASNALKNTPPPVALFATDEALTEPEFSQLKDEAIVYVRNGGTIVFGGHFSAYAAWIKITELFSEFSLPWQTGDYLRTTFDLNTAMTKVQKGGLAPSYSQKAVHLVNVQREDALYIRSTSSRLQSLVFAPTPIEDLTQTPVALGSSGEGKVGYIGDVNAEVASENVVLALLGL